MLRLELTARGEAAEGVVVNDADEVVQVDLIELGSPSIALEVLDERGERVRMPPPPTPGKPEVVELTPGERRTVAFRGFLPARGRYRVRFRYRDAASDWVELQVS